MRKIGTIPDEQDARTFRDYLLTLGIKSEVNPDNNHAQVVWVLEEDQLERARSELAEFVQAPRSKKYAGVVEAAQRQRDAELKEAMAARKRQVNLRERWERPLVAQLPVTMLMIGFSIVVAILSHFGMSIKPGSFTESLFISSRILVPPALPEIARGELWRFVTPIFLHFGWLHLIGNMYMLFVLGGSVESAKGPWKYLGLVLFIGVLSNFGQFVASGPNFGGMSGVDFGLFGYLWMKSRYAPEEGFFMPQYVVVQAMIWMGLCIFRVIPHVANTAHTVGLVAGMIVALIPVVYRHLMR
jgi:GlpG protein